MTPAWAQRQEALLRDCIVSPDVFTPMVDRLRDFVAPYQHALETEAGQRNVHLYLAGLLSHVDRKNAEKIAALVDNRDRAKPHSSPLPHHLAYGSVPRRFGVVTCGGEHSIGAGPSDQRIDG
jgi:hypothetical protein